MELEQERIKRKTFEALPEYSCSLPSLTTIGKVWRCNLNAYHPDPEVRKTPDWIICEYVEKTPVDPNRVAIDKRRPIIIEEET